MHRTPQPTLHATVIALVASHLLAASFPAPWPPMQHLPRSSANSAESAMALHTSARCAL